MRTHSTKKFDKIAKKKVAEAEELFRLLRVKMDPGDGYEPLAIYSGAPIRGDQPILFGRISPNSNPFLVVE